MYYETVTRAVKAGFVYKKTIGTGDEFAKVIFRLGTAAVWEGSARLWQSFRAGKSTVRSAYSRNGDNCAMQLRRRVQTH